jgi:hypothetical protein
MIHKPHRSGLLVPASFAESPARRPDMREVATTRDGRDITRGYVDPMMIMQPSDCAGMAITPSTRKCCATTRWPRVSTSDAWR